MDKYTRVVLTIIAILLALNLIKPLNVNIVKFGGYSVDVGRGGRGSGIPVHVTNLD